MAVALALSPSCWHVAGNWDNGVRAVRGSSVSEVGQNTVNWSHPKSGTKQSFSGKGARLAEKLERMKLVCCFFFCNLWNVSHCVSFSSSGCILLTPVPSSELVLKA